MTLRTVFLLLLFTLGAIAQANAINGTVKDPNGAVVAGANVNIK